MDDTKNQFELELIGLIKEKFNSDKQLETYSEKELYKNKIIEYFSLLSDANQQDVLDDLIENFSTKVDNAKYVENSKSPLDTNDVFLGFLLFFMILPFSVITAITFIFVYRYFKKNQIKNDKETQNTQLQLKLDVLTDLIQLVSKSNKMDSTLKLNTIQKDLDTLQGIKSNKENSLSNLVDKSKPTEELNKVGKSIESEEPDVKFKSAEYIELEEKINYISDNLLTNYPTDIVQINSILSELKESFYSFLHPETTLDEIMQERVDEQLETSKQFIYLVYNQIISNNFNLLKSSTAWKTVIMTQFESILDKMKALEQEIATVYLQTLEDEFKILFGEELTEEVLNNFDVSTIQKIEQSTVKTDVSNPLEKEAIKEDTVLTEEEKVVKEAIKEVQKIQEFR